MDKLKNMNMPLMVKYQQRWVQHRATTYTACTACTAYSAYRAYTTQVHFQKKNDIIWEFFPNVGPPPHPPPFGNPFSKKNFSVYFAFQNLRSIFVLQKKIIFQVVFYCQFWEQGTPPPFWEKFPNNVVFFKSIPKSVLFL